MTAGRKINTKSIEWGTPHKYVNAVKNMFDGSIHLDPCSNKWSIVEAKTTFMLPDQDGLNEDWNYNTIYVNPPYGFDRARNTSIKHWLRKIVQTRDQYQSEILALIPVATNTGHWKEYVWAKATAICFLYDTRLKFLENGIDKGKGAPMACAMIYWGDNYDKFFSIFLEFGAVIDLTSLSNQQIGIPKQESSK